MRKVILFTLAAVALAMGFASCNNEDDTIIAGDDQTLLVQLPASVNTRAVEAPIDDNSFTDVVDFTVFILNGQSVVKAYEYLKGDLNSDNSVRIENVPGSMTKVIVVANSHGDISTLTNETAIKKNAFSVDSQNDDNDSGVANKTMIGEGIPEDATDPAPTEHAGHGYKKVEIKLDALTARIEVGGLEAGVGINTLEVLGVWINNYYSDAATTDLTLHASNNTVWNINPATSTGTENPFTDAPTIPEYSEVNYFDNGANSSVLPTGTNVYAYQLFAGSYTPHLVFLVRGELDEGAYTDPNKYFMGFVTFRRLLDADNSNVEINALLANKIYKVGMDGITITPDMITDKPELATTDLGVFVTITNWTVVNVNPGI